MICHRAVRKNNPRKNAHCPPYNSLSSSGWLFDFEHLLHTENKVAINTCGQVCATFCRQWFFDVANVESPHTVKKKGTFSLVPVAVLGATDGVENKMLPFGISGFDEGCANTRTPLFPDATGERNAIKDRPTRALTATIQVEKAHKKI